MSIVQPPKPLEREHEATGRYEIGEIELPGGAILQTFEVEWRDAMYLVECEPYSHGHSRGYEWEHDSHLVAVILAGRSIPRDEVLTWWGAAAVEAIEHEIERQRLNDDLPPWPRRDEE